MSAGNGGLRANGSGGDWYVERERSEIASSRNRPRFLARCKRQVLCNLPDLPVH